MICDLHLHTTCSDGSLTPSELIRRVNLSGIKFCAICDHDCVDGLSEGVKKGEELGVEVIRGIELSTYLDSEIHILGYGMRVDDAFEKELVRARSFRRNRNLEMLDKLKTFGIVIKEEELYDGKGKTKGRFHIAKLMLAKKYVSSINEAFDQWLGKNGKAYVSAQRLSPEEGVEIISKSGGIAVLAHPSDRREREDFDSFINSLIDAGLKGVEAFHPSHQPKDRCFYVDLAKEKNLLITGGSDFHSESANIKIGAGMADLSLSTIETIRNTNNLNGDKK